ALEDADALVGGEQPGRCAGERLVQLYGHERHAGRQRRDDPCGADRAAGAELADPRPATLRGEDVQEPSDLRDARALEAELPLERERARYEGGFLHARTLGRMLPVPPHFDPGTVGEVWRVPYEARAREAEEWAQEHALRHAAEDAPRICLVAVDVQNT